MNFFDGAPDETHAIFEEWEPKRHAPRNEGPHAAHERAALAVWTDWAMAQADRLDPLSGDAVWAGLQFRGDSVAASDD